MKQRSIIKKRTAPPVSWRMALQAAMVVMLLLAGPGRGALEAQVQTFTCTAPGGFGPVIAPFIPLTSLKTVPNPILPGGKLRADLTDYIANLPAAIQLGKALFWDMQAGSDNKTACATCHFQAGADVRNQNQLNPGANGLWDSDGAPNRSLVPGAFPFTTAAADRDNIAGSQGVRKSAFLGIRRIGIEMTTPIADPVFRVGTANVRQVTGKNTPPAVNAVFNHRNFWDGRAQPDFNGQNPFGSRDASARVWVLGTSRPITAPVQVAISIPNASLASQAVGPPLNGVEMSAAGRTFPDLGKKLLAVTTKPLRGQKVDPADSVLGGIADPSTGLRVSYASLVRQAFQPKWWNSAKQITIGRETYSMAEVNFSLFWGLAIMLYEATLVSDNSPLDQYLDLVGTDRPGAAHPTAQVLDQVVSRLAAEGIIVTREDILNGLALFEQPIAPPPQSFPAPAGFGLGCVGCHVGAELTSASVRNLTGLGLEPGNVAFRSAGFDQRLERMFMNFPPVPPGTDAVTFDPATYTANVSSITGTLVLPPSWVPIATYDAGWYNTGVRYTGEDPGLGGKDPFGKYLSWTRLFQSLDNPAAILVPGNGLGCLNAGNAVFPHELLQTSGFPLLSGPLHALEATDIDGSFKTSQLRNVELTGPYFHNGGKATLRQVVDFYNKGGDFHNPTLAPAMVAPQLTDSQTNSLVAFLIALTDERVRLQQAPFDHPQLWVPNGDNPAGRDSLLEIPAVGAGGSPAGLKRFLNLNPFLP